MLVNIILSLCLVSSILALPLSIEKLLHRRNLARVSFKECNINPTERHDCGHYGITEEGCYARECCWNEAEERGVPWCYHSIPTSQARCTASGAEREECGWFGIRKEQCLAQECCWRPGGKDEAWCFKKIRIPAYTGECGHPAIKPITLGRVIGGIESRPHSWPWMVSMQMDGRHGCGGSLINHQWVLSAGHCDMGAEGIDIALGLHHVNSSYQDTSKVTIPVAATFPHEMFGRGPGNQGVGYDYMLIKLQQPVEFNDFISPVCLTEEAPHAGKHCYSMGWGLSRFEILPDYDYIAERPNPLMQFMSPVVDPEVCNSTAMYDGRVASTSMCAGYEEGGRGNCFGDSGGPLVCKTDDRWQQVGIVSWGEPCAKAMYPTVYADVSQIGEWIDNTVADN